MIDKRGLKDSPLLVSVSPYPLSPDGERIRVRARQDL